MNDPISLAQHECNNRLGTGRPISSLTLRMRNIIFVYLCSELPRPQYTIATVSGFNELVLTVLCAVVVAASV